MPNWTTNHLEIVGPLADITTLINTVRSRDTEFDFATIIPTPEGMYDYGGGVSAKDDAAIEHLSRLGDAEADEIIRQVYGGPVPQAQKEALIAAGRCYRETGYKSWHDFCSRNWNTKWNACHCDNWDVVPSSVGPSHAYITFDTAWDAPRPIFEKISEMFPALTIYAELRHESGGVEFLEYGPAVSA